VGGVLLCATACLQLRGLLRARSNRTCLCRTFHLPQFSSASRHSARASLLVLACRYFASRNSLPKQYWTSFERNGSFSLYAFPDLSYLSQVASNDPYAHW
jgi:hypothetical protein